MTDTVNILINAGETWSYVLNVYDHNTEAPLNLTGYTAEFMAKAFWSDSTYLLHLTSSPAAGIVMGGALGTITLSASSGVTRALNSAIPSLNQAQEILPIGQDQDGNTVNAQGFPALLHLELTKNGTVVRQVQGTLLISPALKTA